MGKTFCQSKINGSLLSPDARSASSKFSVEQPQGSYPGCKKKFAPTKRYNKEVSSSFEENEFPNKNYLQCYDPISCAQN